jgi:hypothetical protein
MSTEDDPGPGGPAPNAESGPGGPASDEGAHVAPASAPRSDEAPASDAAAGGGPAAPSATPLPAADPPAGDDDRDGEAGDDGEGLRHLLRGALGDEPETPDVLGGVQRKLRVRSGGKFFSDGWSTERQPPIQTYLVTSLVMLAIVIAIWAVLYPISGEPAVVEPPAPVRVLPPP